MSNPVINLCPSEQAVDRAGTVASVLDFLCDAINALSNISECEAPLNSSSLDGLSAIILACSATLSLIDSSNT